MLSTIHSNRIKGYLEGKVIDLTKYKCINYKIYNYNEDNILHLDIKPLIELIQVLQQVGYIWGNGLSLHINNFSDLTEQGKLNREILKTHKYIVFENENRINLAYNWRSYVNLDDRVEIISIEDVLDYYWKYRTEKGLYKNLDINELMIGDFIELKGDLYDILEIKGLEYERSNSFLPSRFIVKRLRKLDIKSHETIDEVSYRYYELKEILQSGKVESVKRMFDLNIIEKYRKEEV